VEWASCDRDFLGASNDLLRRKFLPQGPGNQSRSIELLTPSTRPRHFQISTNGNWWLRRYNISSVACVFVLASCWEKKQISPIAHSESFVARPSMFMGCITILQERARRLFPCIGKAYRIPGWSLVAPPSAREQLRVLVRVDLQGGILLLRESTIYRRLFVYLRVGNRVRAHDSLYTIGKYGTFHSSAANLPH
jgi:hypothetical protein